jgi:uncharacterized membrane protein YdbT with pleckstrin-like domain
MVPQRFKPNSRYLYKLLVVYTAVALLILAGILLLGGLISLDDGRVGLIIIAIMLPLNFIWWVCAMILAFPYYRSLEYEVLDDEVIVRVGIFTHSVKHVPYRTVTNITVKRDIFDRWFFNLGSLNIQTAGMSGQSGAEEQLVGLENVQEIYEMVATELRRFRSAMSPTQAESEDVIPTANQGAELLAEVKAIRGLLEKNA